MFEETLHFSLVKREVRTFFRSWCHPGARRWDLPGAGRTGSERSHWSGGGRASLFGAALRVSDFFFLLKLLFKILGSLHRWYRCVTGVNSGGAGNWLLRQGWGQLRRPRDVALVSMGQPLSLPWSRMWWPGTVLAAQALWDCETLDLSSFMGYILLQNYKY